MLGEGDTEQLVIPRVAQAQGVDLDPSFVAVVPLGGRHTNHMWKLLNDLAIPHATLLDLDYGRAGAGPARLRDACNRLIDNGLNPLSGLDDYDDVDDIDDDLQLSDLWPIIRHLRTFGIFFATPLDLDYIMLKRFPPAYKKREQGEWREGAPQKRRSSERHRRGRQRRRLLENAGARPTTALVPVPLPHPFKAEQPSAGAEPPHRRRTARRVLHSEILNQWS